MDFSMFFRGDLSFGILLPREWCCAAGRMFTGFSPTSGIFL